MTLQVRVAAVGLALSMVLALGPAGCAEVVNHASLAAGATISGPRNASGSAGQPNCAIDGSLDFSDRHGYAWAYLDTPTTVTFAAPAVIDAVEVVLNDLGGRSYSYRLSLSPDGQQWQVVADVSGERVVGYRCHRFEPIEARALRLEFTSTSVPAGSYHIVEIAAWRLGEATAGPLGERWRTDRQRRAREGEALLGVSAAQELLARPEVLARARALAEGRSFQQSLPDGTKVLLLRDLGHIVMVTDDDGDMDQAATGPDGDSDCLAVDMDMDGRIDRTIDYDDTTGDGRADRMVLTHVDQHTWGSRPFMVVIKDLDRGPLTLWALHDYGYHQGRCQWDCDFGGDGWFCMFRRARANDRWAGALEAPFCFYDLDGDGLAEETVRITATDTTLHSARYGINADNDTTEGELYDYDLSVTCLGSVALPPEAGTTFTHRSGDQAGPFLAWDRTRDVVRAAAWERALLIWDENDHNTASPPERERWEGIINAPYRGFPQEGGPATPRFNKRFELDADFSGAMQLYFWAADGRLHLLGAEQGSLEVDYNYDGVTDLAFEYADTDADGRFDERTVTFPGTDLPGRRMHGLRRYTAPDADGTQAAGAYECSYEAIAAPWQSALVRWRTDAGELLAALAQVAGELGVRPHTAPMDFYATATPADFPFIERLRASKESRRYYQDVTIELCFAHLIADAERAGAPKRAIARLSSAWRLYHAGYVRAAADQCRQR